MGSVTHRSCSSACVCVCLLVLSLFVDMYLMELVHGEEENDVSSICELNGCNCTTMHKYWKIVNCTFDNKRIINLRASILPTNVIELSVTGGQELLFHAQLFSSMKNFQRLRTDGTRTVMVKKNAFVNLTVNSLLVQLAACDSLVFETWAFKNMQGAVTTEVSRCRRVSVQKSVFSFLQDATFQEISRLELAEEAFTMQTRPLGHHGPVTTIRFRNVHIPAIPKDTFKSTLAEVSLEEADVGEVMSDAFSGYTISAVSLINSTLKRVHSRAFTDRTQLYNLLVSGCRLQELDSGALLSATTNLTLQHSRVNLIHSGAINATIAKTVIHNNEFGTIHSRAFSIHDWSRINIDNNFFEHLDDTSFNIPIKPSQHQDQEFTFTGNDLLSVDYNSLNFITEVAANLSNAHYDNNYFRYTCHCDIEKWLSEKLGDQHPKFSGSNFCLIDSMLAQCYDVPDGPANMRNFTDVFCENGLVMKCKTFSADANIGSDSSDENSHLILGLVLGLVFLVAICGTVVILLIHGGLWLKRKGYCVRFSNFNYRAEEGSTEAEDIMVAVEKTNENLPDELTQELLQALREKLEDPQTYNEAREMIERLYDHFIVEDSYTNNNRQEEETHLYEELGNLPNPNVDVDKTTPTRPFSFLRLIEERFNLTPVEATETPKNSVLVAEYSEPTDAEIHLYSELPQSIKKGKHNEVCDDLINREDSGTQRSNGSGRMAYRPLPDKPKPLVNDPGEGPSTKF